MLRCALPLAATLLLAAPLAAQKSPDPTGTWTITNSTNDYRGQVTIKPNGDCYNVQWTLESGEVYDGVGLVVDVGIWKRLIVAWGGTGNYGVVFYQGKGAEGYAGRWCQPDGRAGVERLSSGDLEGTHQLAPGNSGTGTVTFTQVPGDKVNYSIRWQTSKGNYTGYGIRLADWINMIGAIWGSEEGGVVLYDLKDVAEGTMKGVWGIVGGSGLSVEDLSRR
jgi:hypothetical protein